MDLFKKCFDYTIVKDAIKEGIYPYFHALDSKQDIVVIMEGKRKIMIGSNNYMGLTSDPRVIQAGKNAILKYGSGCSGSRFLNGTLTIHIELEKDLAEFLHKEAVMTFSTGFQANLGIISAIAGKNDVILCDRENHASIYDGCRLSYAELLRYRHSDMEDLESQLKKIPEEKGRLIITDGVFSMGGDICKLPEIVKLAKKYDARVMIDDAHGLGVMGACGRGTAEHFGLENEVDILMGTFSKSLASLGGYMAATKDVIDYVRHNSRPFIFCASIPPANVACAHEALNIIKAEPQRVKALLDISEYARQCLKAKGIKIRDSKTPIVPIYTYGIKRTFIACKQLYERGVYVNPVIPPATPQGECLIRTSYTATHTKELIDEAVGVIADVLNNLPEMQD